MEMEAINRQVQDVLASKKPVSLGSKAADMPLCPRAGVIVFHRSKADIAFYLVLPKKKADKPTPPDHQIAKGGRTVLVLSNDGAQNYIDVRKPSDLEKGMPLDPNMDALREAVEEQGLRLGNIVALYELGMVEFISESKGTKEPMWCMAAEIKDKDAFDTSSDPKTESNTWFVLSDLKDVLEQHKNASKVKVHGLSIRADHIKILIDFALRLVRHEGH